MDTTTHTVRYVWQSPSNVAPSVAAQNSLQMDAVSETCQRWMWKAV